MFKKLFFLGASLLIGMGAFAQDNLQVSKEISKEGQQLILAGQLVNYGYENQDPLSLIQAVKIYQNLNAKEALDNQKPATIEDETTRSGLSKADQPKRNEKQMLADATTYAKGDANILALIEGCNNVKRDPVGGAILRYFRIPARSTQDWEVTLRGGTNTIIEVSGDGTTDLDLYVYEGGRLVCSDTRVGDDCIVSVDAYSTCTVTVRVKNLGYVYNDYILAIY